MPKAAGTPEFVRAFVAVDAGLALRARLTPIFERLRQIDCQVRWVPSDHWHLTLKFLGDVDTAVLPRLSEAIRESAAQVPVFEFAARGLFPFPSGRKPRIVAAGIEDPDRQLERLHLELEDRMQAFGIRPEGRGFNAHLTLGRVQGFADRLWKTLKQYEAKPFGTVRVTAVTLYKSDLLPQGARYTKLAEFNMG